MTEAIRKDIYVMQCGLPVTVDYVQATNAIPIVFEIRDYTIPSGAEARLYIKKPSGKEVYTPADISENTVTINPTTQMFAEFGHQKGQLQIVSGAKTLVTFPIIFHVSRNMISESAVESTNEYTILDQLIVDARSAVSAANSAVKKAEEAVGKVEGSSEKADKAARRANEAAEKVEGLEVSGLLDQISDVKEEMDALAPGIIETATGESIVLDDSSDKPMAGLHIYGKSEQTKTNGYQLLDILKAKQLYGILDEVRNDGFTWTYSSEGDNTRLVNIPCDLKKGVQYVLNAEVSSDIISFYLPETTQCFPRKVPFIPTENITKFGVYVGRSDDNHGVYKVSNLIVNEGSSPKPFEPYTGGKPSPSPEYPQEIESVGDDGSVDVSVFGSNLLDVKSTENAGAKLEVSGDAITVLNKLQADHIYTRGYEYVFFLPKGTYTLKADNIIGSFIEGGFRIQINLQNTKKVISAIEERNKSSTFILDKGETVSFTIFTGYKEPNKSYMIKGLRLNAVKEHPFEPYKPVQTLTLQTPNGLPGIPVKSDGNYTDSSGQQWICDEIDLERGKYVQRVHTVRPNIDENTTVYETEDYKGRYAISIGKNNYFKGGVNCFITHGQYGSWAMKKNTFDINSNLICYRPDETMTVGEVKKKIIAMCNDDIPFTICGILVNPIERDLSSEEIQQYEQLHTNYPNTSILNSGSAGMKVDYIADTKAYIFKKIESPLQKQITDLQNALISGKISGGV